MQQPKATTSSGDARTEKEHKEDDVAPYNSSSNGVPAAGGGGPRFTGAPSLPSTSWRKTTTTPTSATNSKRLNLVSVLIGNCTGMCTSFPSGTPRGGMGGSSELQFVELQGLRYIGLGALVDELSPKERVYDTLEQLRTRTERLISIGYLVDKHPSEHNHHQSSNSAVASTSKTTQTVPLDVWNINNRDTRQSMSKHVELIVELTKNKRFHALKEELTAQLRVQKLHSSKGHNRYLSGITAHNLGVLAVLTGKPEEAVSYFREAICLKETAFGRTDAEVALSWDELGIQFFARGDFDGALTSFREAHSVRNGLLQQQQQLQQLQQQQQQQQQLEPDSGVALSPAQHPSVAMVLNNMACCYFQMGNARQALLTLEEADEIQQRAVGSSVQAELDLLHVAIVICNCGYMKLALKQYEDARSLLEEALLIQQSVLDDHHRAVRDTLSNIEFANAFHS